MGARVKLPKELDMLLRSELERVIHEAALSYDDNLIATKYIIDKVAQIDIAAEIGWERSTVSKHVKQILIRIKYIASKIYPSHK